MSSRPNEPTNDWDLADDLDIGLESGSPPQTTIVFFIGQTREARHSQLTSWAEEHFEHNSTCASMHDHLGSPEID